jgi:hypothetical protein
MHPAVGWVRANTAANVQVLSEINELRKQNAQLREALADASPRPVLKDLAGLDEPVRMFGEYWHPRYNTLYGWGVDTTWRTLFQYVSPYLVQHPSEDRVKNVLAEALFKTSGEKGTNVKLDDQLFQTVGIQLKALGLVKLSYSQTTTGGMALFWSLTGAGEQLLLQVRTVRTSENRKA